MRSRSMTGQYTNCDCPKADIERGFTQLDFERQEAFGYLGPTYDYDYIGVDPMAIRPLMGGFLGRPGGWER